ncbi:MAG: hypothetical protein GXX90_09535 [Microbacteriaceae bacterium]|nr:hypothetical protein [Microbacteriaceae bacterium]
MIPVIDVDLEAIDRNHRAVREAVGVPVMPIVKASGYGHGALPVARTVEAGGAGWIGVADGSEGVALRAAGLRTRLLCWLHSPTTTWDSLIAAELDLGVSSLEQLALIGSAAEHKRRGAHASTVNVHLKLDTGLGRGGAAPLEWRTLLAQARDYERRGRIRVAGIMSHLSGTSPADDAEQAAEFARGCELAAELGLDPEIRHLAASGAALRSPGTRFDLVRLGIALYGLEPDAGIGAGLGLRPALRLRGPIQRLGDRWAVGVGSGDGLPPLPAGHALPPLVDSAGEQWRVDEVTPVHLIVSPLGEPPAIAPRPADPDAESGADPARELIVIGRPDDGGATADDWAAAAGTINYEITTRLSGRIARRYEPGAPSDEARVVAWPPIEDPGRAVTSPVREAVVDLELFARRLARLRRRADTVGADRDQLAYAIDVSSDAYGHGLAELLPFLRDSALPLIVRTRNDLEMLRRRDADARLVPDAPTGTRAIYGLDPEQPLRATLSLRSELVHVKRVPAGQRASYGYEWTASEPTVLGLVPLGYADALPRSAFGRASVTVGGCPVPIVGRVAMDQVVVDLGGLEAWPGMRVQVWGNEPGERSLGEWAQWTGWSPESLCASIGERVDRVYIGRKTSGFGQ